MATLHTENSQVKVVEGGQAAAFGNVVLLVIGTIGSLTGLVKLLAVTWSVSSSFLFALAFLLVGLICLLGFLARSKTEERYSLTIEGDSVRFEREGRAIQFARQDFTAVELQHDPNGRAKVPTYALFLRRADGSYFWLMSSTIVQRFQPWFNALAAALQCPGVNATGRDLPELTGITMAAPVSPSPAHPAQFETKKLWAKLGQGKTGELLLLQSPMNWIGRTILSLAAVLFVGVPAGFLYLLISETGPDGISLGAIPFLAIFISLALLIFVIATKRFEVELRMDQIRAKISLGPAILAQLLPQIFTRERIIPRAEIVQVRVDRLVAGNYRLVLVRKNSPGSQPVPLLDKLFFRTGIYAPPQRVPADPGDTVELWELEGWNKIANGPVLEDLLFLEKHIQDRLRLEE